MEWWCQKAAGDRKYIEEMSEKLTGFHFNPFGTWFRFLYDV